MTHPPEVHRYGKKPALLTRAAIAVLPSFSSAHKPSRAEILAAASGRPTWRLFWLLFRDRLPRRNDRGP
jgi:hypothetical protein